MGSRREEDKKEEDRGSEEVEEEEGKRKERKDGSEAGYLIGMDGVWAVYGTVAGGAYRVFVVLMVLMVFMELDVLHVFLLYYTKYILASMSISVTISISVF